MINFHVIALLSPSFIAFVFAVQLFGKVKYNINLTNKVLAWFMIVVLALGSSVAVYQSGNFAAFRFLDAIYMSSMLLLHPLFFIYARTLVSNKLSKKKCFFHILPALINFILASFFYLLLSKNEAIDYLGIHILGKPSDSHIITYLFNLLLVNKAVHIMQAAIYFILAFKMLNKHQKYVDQIFSTTDNYKLKWLFYFNIVYCVMSLAGIVINLIPLETVNTTTIYIDCTMLIFASFTLYIGIKGLKQESVGQIIDLNDKLAFKKELRVPPNESVKEKVNNYIIGKKAFLNPELKIWDIVENIGINRSYISQFINNEYNISFSHYINKLRIEKACCLLEGSINKSIEGIAFDSGFNSLSTFNRAFKKFKGVLPSEYRLKL